MNDLIDREDAINAIYHHFPHLSMKDTTMVLYEVPTVEERKKGKWEEITNNEGGTDFRCSACHRYRFHNGEMKRKYKFCPNCGADMRE